MRKNLKLSSPGLEFGDLRLAWLQTFVVVSRSDSRSSAAKKLAITQSAVTKHIQNLERWSQKVLVHSNSAPAKLTDEGQAFVAVADDILEVMAKARKLEATSSEPKARISDNYPRVPPSVPKLSTA